MYHTVNYPDVGEQIRLIHKMIEQKADGIILSPINSPEIVSVIDYCNGLHIPIITVNTDVKGSQRFVLSDRRENVQEESEDD